MDAQFFAATEAAHAACCAVGPNPAEAGHATLLSLAYATNPGDDASFNSARKVTASHLAAVLRCIFGNPFRPITLDPSWLTTTAKQLAKSIYQDRAFDRLPILADALEDAGCNQPDILGHLRSGGEHCRGCWAVDLVTGKE
jgi:hypothetical protein